MYVNMETSRTSGLVELYNEIKPDIEGRLREFETRWESGNDEDIFAELTFCLLTPQSKAKVCWPAVEAMMADRSLFSGDQEVILQHVAHIRFKNNKTKYILLARELFTDNKSKIDNADNNGYKNNYINIKSAILNLGQPMEAREWLIENVKGMGYKESTHFLRNIGMGGDMAILDRHILRNLEAFGIIEEIPTSISKNRYLNIEKKMRTFSKDLGIPMDHLDLLLWYKEAGEIFK